MNSEVSFFPLLGLMLAPGHHHLPVWLLMDTWSINLHRHQPSESYKLSDVVSHTARSLHTHISRLNSVSIDDGVTIGPLIFLIKYTQRLVYHPPLIHTVCTVLNVTHWVWTRYCTWCVLHNISLQILITYQSPLHTNSNVIHEISSCICSANIVVQVHIHTRQTVIDKSETTSFPWTMTINH